MRKMRSRALILAAIIAAGVSFTGCEDDNDSPSTSVSINETGSDLGGDVTGDGGSTTKNYTWNNPLTSADWNMDITAAHGGSLNLLIEAADGQIVLDETLTVEQGEDSKSGVTSTGISGEWAITVTLTDFDGDGSFSLSPGD